MTIIEVRDLVKSYGSIVAVKGISFTVEEGEIFGLVGPNGAGKTTTFRVLATLLLPTSGNVRVCNFDVVKDADKVRRCISYLPEEAGVYRNITGYEFLKLIARTYFKSVRDAEEALELGIKLSGLGDRLYDRMKTYSKGMKRRVQIARALMVRPKVAILDEPTSGLDVSYAYSIRELIKDFTKKYGVTILISSHNMFEVEDLCSRVALISEGRILTEGYVKELVGAYGVRNLEELFIRLVGRDDV